MSEDGLKLGTQTCPRLIPYDTIKPIVLALQQYNATPIHSEKSDKDHKHDLLQAITETIKRARGED